jgi:hypothetical protein
MCITGIQDHLRLMLETSYNFIDDDHCCQNLLWQFFGCVQIVFVSPRRNNNMGSDLESMVSGMTHI